MLTLVINLLITALVVFLCAKFMPGVTVKSFGWAFVVAIVVAVLNVLVTWLMSLLGIGAVGSGVIGFCIGLAVDTCIILLADRLMDNFSVQNWKWALAVAAVSMLVSAVLGGVL